MNNVQAQAKQANQPTQVQYVKEYRSPIGMFTLASDGEHLTGLWLKGQKYFGATLENEEIDKKCETDETGGVIRKVGEVDDLADKLPLFHLVEQWLDAYFQGKQPELSLPLAPKGSPFRQDVWDILCQIPYGEVITYGDIAKKMAQKLGKDTMSAQAIGGAVGHNPISIIIPCHRVVGANGSLTGYAGGIENKIKLLELEQVDLTRFSIPTRGSAL
ncbi:methylated-DNA-[protein]-cysteine S-methyltransferase [Paenibacillus turicensis]|uniref:Methylated-DNA--protein-cysteine methyltransferase n=1 Tax=Paenibacillus turicensis TaxID=160487 RepID=A0ABS4FV78_9BACL|nr:methylated-DNA--[protein]-cysteine S-methyltransferase [Paenibacillus turicensis]MBP1906485.1 methylated-DNA-[protein]-cysteine S-methyltransferase [Paenibacillus turicensis]